MESVTAQPKERIDKQNDHWDVDDHHRDYENIQGSYLLLVKSLVLVLVAQAESSCIDSLEVILSDCCHTVTRLSEN